MKATYNAYFNGRVIQLEADSQYAAKLQAITRFGPRKSQQHMVSVVLVSRDDGSVVTHSTAEM